MGRIEYTCFTHSCELEYIVLGPRGLNIFYKVIKKLTRTNILHFKLSDKTPTTTSKDKSCEDILKAMKTENPGLIEMPKVRPTIFVTSINVKG